MDEEEKEVYIDTEEVKEREAIEEAYNSGGFDTVNFCDDSKKYYDDKYGK